MQTIDTYGTFEQAIAGSSPQAQQLARALRTLLEEVYPNATEVPWPNQHVIGYGIGPKKMTEHFGYIGAHRDHVNLGFNYGVALPDPEGLLEGAGKKFRHVKVRKPKQVSHAGLRALIEAAVQDRERALGRRR